MQERRAMWIAATIATAIMGAAVPAMAVPPIPGTTLESSPSESATTIRNATTTTSTRTGVTPRSPRFIRKLRSHKSGVISFADVAELPRDGVAKIHATVSVRSSARGSLSLRPRAGNTATAIRFSARQTKKAHVSRSPGTPRGWTIRNNGRRTATVTITVTGHTLAANPDSNPGDSGPPANNDTPREIDQSPGPIGTNDRYDTGTFTGTSIYVNPTTGADNRAGDKPGTALRTITAALNRIPRNTNLTTGYRIQLASGTYAESDMPNVWEDRLGTHSNPVIINAVDGPGTAILRGHVSLYNMRYTYFTNVDILRNGDAFHCELCSYTLLRNSRLEGDVNPGGDEAHETFKANQSDHLYIEDSTIAGADDNAIDFVAVQYGHLRGNRISNADDWCAYAKGGSAYLTVADNEIYDCGTGGFTAGQGAGIEFTTSPWITYEAMDIKIVNNVVHDTAGAGLGVNGGYNILLAYNTIYRVGTRSHLIEFVFGLHSCDGGRDEPRCAQRLTDGGWGTTGGDEAYIPNNHVYFYNNVIMNPSGYESGDQHFAIYAPRSQPNGALAPDPARTDTDLRIGGNVVWNGGTNKPLGIEDGGGCQSGNPTCTLSQLIADNAINTHQPDFINAAGLDFTPAASGWLASRAAVTIPSFSWSDRPDSDIPVGSTSNTVELNRAGVAREGWGHPGAY